MYDDAVKEVKKDTSVDVGSAVLHQVTKIIPPHCSKISERNFTATTDRGSLCARG